MSVNPPTQLVLEGGEGRVLVCVELEGVAQLDRGNQKRVLGMFVIVIGPLESEFSVPGDVRRWGEVNHLVRLGGVT